MAFGKAVGRRVGTTVGCADGKGISVGNEALNEIYEYENPKDGTGE